MEIKVEQTSEKRVEIKAEQTNEKRMEIKAEQTSEKRMEIKSEKTSKKRMENIELLRLLSMFMVVMLHYLSKGGLLSNLTGTITINGYIAWILETLSIAAVNIYMLISGFFLVSSEFKSRRLINLLLQVLFYSVTIPIILMLTGHLSLNEITIYKLLQYLMPTQMIQYWFVTAYVGMYLFAPLLSTAVHTITKKQLKTIILLLLTFYSFSKSVVIVRLEMDNQGYDSIWFMCVFLIAAYIRLYGISFFKNKKIAITSYLATSLGIFLLTILIRFLYLRTGQLETIIQVAYGYNHILVLLAAISLFYTFYYIKLPENNGAASKQGGKLAIKIANFICTIAPATFGVYLIHEHIDIRYLWPSWLGATLEGPPLLFTIKCLASPLLILSLGIIIDLLRTKLFTLLAKLPPIRKTNYFLEKLDSNINGS